MEIRPNRLLILTVALVIAALGVTAGVLRTAHHQQREKRVMWHNNEGDQLAAAGDPERAVAQYRAALQLSRDDAHAGRAVALTLLRLGRLSEAESYLADLLRHAPTDGELNRGIARINAARGRDADARAAYQRAIYGEWPGDGVEARTQTRFELVEYLARTGGSHDVLPELLRLRSELPTGRTAIARQAADLLAANGAHELAIETLRSALLTAPRDVDLLGQLADTQLAAGRTSEARTTLQRAVAIEGRRDLADRLALVDRVLSLDPTLPQLGIVARTRRAQLLLSAVLRQTAACAADAPALRRAAQQALPRRTTDARHAERQLELAARLWTASSACRGESVEARAIGQVLDRVMPADPR